MKKIQTALVSVTDKAHLDTFLLGLRKINPFIRFIASGGTAQYCSSLQIPFISLSDYTQMPECFGGRVKTLHPKIMGGILYRRGVDDSEAKKLGIEPIDLVICNLYDFESAAFNAETALEQLIEKIDIGGSAMIRSACKNFIDVAVATDPKDYLALLEELSTHQGCLTLETRKSQAVKAIRLSARYDAIVAQELSDRLLNEKIHLLQLSQGRELRYGENPDQKGWVYEFAQASGIAQAKILSGKQLSFNNYEDATLAYHASQELSAFGHGIGVAIVKHGSLCGYATGHNIQQAFQRAWDGDSKSAFGSVIGLSYKATTDLIPQLSNKFIEVLVAREFDHAFIEWAEKSKPNLRLLQVSHCKEKPLIFKSISGGMVVQTRKMGLIPHSLQELVQPYQLRGNIKRGVVTKLQPQEAQCELFAFGIVAVNYLKSNAIAIVREYAPGVFQMIGSGSGQPNRIDCLQRLAIPKTLENLRAAHPNDTTYDPKQDLASCVLASDGFFPFDDTITHAVEHGIKYCIQPGGSTNDAGVIQSADAKGMCMIFTGERYFFH